MYFTLFCIHIVFKTLWNFSTKISACFGWNMSAGRSLTAVSPQPPQLTPSFSLRAVKMASLLALESASMAHMVPRPLAECTRPGKSFSACFSPCKRTSPDARTTESRLSSRMVFRTESNKTSLPGVQMFG